MPGSGPEASFLTGGGEMGGRIAAFDWTGSLGPVVDWPASLKTAVGLLLHSPVPIVLLWGDDGIMIYNDGYAEFAGGRHPQLLGSRVREGWPEVADYNDNVMKVGLAGGTLLYEDRELVLDRTGAPASVWVTVGYSPVFDESGRPGGVIAIVVETTARVSNERALRASEARLRFLDSLAREVAPLDDADALLKVVTRRVGEHMGVSICAYADMDADEDGFTVRGDWTAEGSSSLVGRYRLADFGPQAAAELEAGRPLVVTDVETDFPNDAAAFRQLGVAAVICMPLVKQGRLTALMAILDHAPRAWSEEDLVLIGEVAERSWAHVERAGAEADLRVAAMRLQDANRALEATVAARTRALNDSEEFTRLALSAIGGVGVWTYDIASDRYSYDDAIADLYGLPAAEGASGVSQEAFLANVHPDDRARLAVTIADGMERERDIECEYRLRRPDGAVRWVLSRGHVSFENGRPVRRTGIGVETTSAHQMEDQLRQSQKMEAVGQLTGGLAHDFNNLLTGITGSLELLQARIAQGRMETVDRYVSAAQGAARRAAALTHRLLAFSRRQTLDPRITDVNRLVADLEELIRRTVGPSAHIEVVRAGGLWPTLIDQNQLENALINLCINARDAMPQGGRITIETANTWLDDRTARERDLAPGQYISLCVTDTGSGMTPEVQARAFDPFFTTKPLGEGTGLGLSMIYGFVRQSGGQVRIYSEVGRGTTVCLYLPRDRSGAEVEAGHAPADSPPAPAGAGQVVLVVDDEPTIRMLIAEVLQEAGYASVEAGDGPAGMRVLQSNARIDLLITDVGLPGGMNGRQIADAARVLRPGLKVLFITGYAENAAVGGGHLEPGMAVLTKPFAIETLAQRVRGMVEG